MNGHDDIELLERIYNGVFKTKLQERLDAELEEERATFDFDDDGFVITKDTGPAGFYPGEPQDCEGGE